MARRNRPKVEIEKFEPSLTGIQAHTQQEYNKEKLS
jgi:hypothetical protein